MMVPARVASACSPSGSVKRATPKSVSLAWPAASTITLAGLTSRWMMPASCANSSASSSSVIRRKILLEVEALLGVEGVLELAALDVLHHDVRELAFGAEVVHLDDVAVVEPRHRAHLALEAHGIVLARSPRRACA